MTYNFSGLYYRLWGVCGPMLLLGVICIVLRKPFSRPFQIKDHKVGVALVAFSLVLGLFYTSRICFPKVESYTGAFIQSNRNSRVAPPLPLTFEFLFWNGQGYKEVVYLDVLSIKNIFPEELVVGKEYQVISDKVTHVIVQIQEA